MQVFQRILFHFEIDSKTLNELNFIQEPIGLVSTAAHEYMSMKPVIVATWQRETYATIKYYNCHKESSMEHTLLFFEQQSYSIRQENVW